MECIVHRMNKDREKPAILNMYKWDYATITARNNNSNKKAGYLHKNDFIIGIWKMHVNVCVNVYMIG